MERRFGHDFSTVRVHADAVAANQTAVIGADAATIGSHIFFGTEKYQPGTDAGRRLLAHELAHVVQQRASRPVLQGSCSAGCRPDPAEQEAERIAAAPPHAPVQVIQRAPTRPQYAVTKGCIAPSFVVDVATASAFGSFAEALVMADYCAKMGCTPFANDFFDNPLGAMSYVAFLAAHHPHLSVPLLATQIGLSGGVLVPDILTARPGMSAFYDVKPNSVDGNAAGRAKLAAIEAFMAFNGLPYVPGASYTPTPEIRIPVSLTALAAALAIPLQSLACGPPIVSLRVTRRVPGLLTYELCMEADFDCYLKVTTLAALLAAAIALAILSGGSAVPAEAPVLVPIFAGAL